MVFVELTNLLKINVNMTSTSFAEATDIITRDKPFKIEFDKNLDKNSIY